MNETNNSYNISNNPLIKDLFIDDFNFRTLLVPGRDSHDHNHNFIEIFYVLNGSITHSVDNTATLLHQGDICILNPRTKHHFVRDGKCIHRDLCFPIDFFRSICDFLGSKVFFNLVQRQSALYASMDTNLISSFEHKILTLMQLQTIPKATEIALKTLAVDLINLFTINEYTNKETLPNISFGTILSLFHKKDVLVGGLKEIKKHIRYSDAYTCRLFKKETGKTMLEYLNEIRLNYASTLLLSTNLSIPIIIAEIGFSSERYFNKIFKEKFGVSPTMYRKNPPATTNKN